MEHLSFDIICRIVDGDVLQNDLESYLIHGQTCQFCRQEIELQRSIVNVSRKGQLVHPSHSFTKSVLSAVLPSQKKKWYEKLVYNMGNLIAMALVISFLVYMFSALNTKSFQSARSNKIKPAIEFIQLLQEGSQQLGHLLTQKFIVQSLDTSHTHTIGFALLAIIFLVLIDRIAGHFFRKLKT